MEPNTRLTYLLERLAAGNATGAELEELQALVDEDRPGAAIGEAESWLEAHRPGEPRPYDHQRWMNVADRILNADKRPETPDASQRPRLQYLHKWWWAAAAVLFAAAGTWWFNHHQPVPAPILAVEQLPDAEPGKNGAILTLADGSQVQLDTAGNGMTAWQSGTKLALDNNVLEYTPEEPGAGELKYNTIATSNGRQFTVVLPDGSKVWLNAASSLRFPVAFNGDSRTVDFTGEAYFEVAKNAAKPFRVKVPGKIDLEVLGTSFNVNAYANEASSYTTLVTGAVRVARAGSTAGAVVLKPGEQLQAEGGRMEVTGSANLDKAIAWKNGLFNFDGAGLRDMMRQLERWYDLEVVYEGDVPDVVFFGEMSRRLKLSDVLAGLERSDVHFRLEAGRRLIVMP